LPILDCFLARVVWIFLGSLGAWIPIRAAKDTSGERSHNEIIEGSHAVAQIEASGVGPKSAPFIKLGPPGQVRQQLPKHVLATSPFLLASRVRASGGPQRAGSMRFVDWAEAGARAYGDDLLNFEDYAVDSQQWVVIR